MAVPIRAPINGSPNPNTMHMAKNRRYRLAALAVTVWALYASAVMAQVPVPATGPVPYKLRVVGGLATVTQFTRWEEPFWSKELARISGGRFSADIVAFDRAGIPGPEMLRLLQMGVVPFGTTLMSSLSAKYPQYTAPDLAGLNPDMASLKTSLTAFRPYLEKALRDQHGIEVLAIYTYPAQVIFCKKPLTGLADLSGRRIRVSSAGQADFVGALGGVPINIPFVQIVSSLREGNIECAITGTMSGNTLDLPAMTSHLYPMPISWGLAIFGANRAAWEAVPPDLRALLRRELPKLEASIWAESAHDTEQGIACNSGSPNCQLGTKGRMAIVPVPPSDERRRQELFLSAVLPKWLQRCGASCAEVWSQTIGPARHIAISPAQ
jgi:TRAP-type C4-dicarboxylate transport system substrate-binding protein